MKKMTPLLIAIITLISCKNTSNKIIQESLNTEQNKFINTIDANLSNKKELPYNITFNIEKNKDNEYNLVVNMILFDGTYFLAPSSDIMFIGRFDISLTDTESILLDSNYFEYPSPTLEFDSFGNGPIMVQRVNSTYKKRIIINTDKDFEILGLVQFTIEPKCTLEKIRYTISSKLGVIEVIKN